MLSYMHDVTPSLLYIYFHTYQLWTSNSKQTPIGSHETVETGTASATAGS